MNRNKALPGQERSTVYELARPTTLPKKYAHSWERRSQTRGGGRPACIVPEARLNEWDGLIFCAVRAAATGPPPPYLQAGRLRSQPCAFPLKFHDYFAKSPTLQSAIAFTSKSPKRETAAWKR